MTTTNIAECRIDSADIMIGDTLLFLGTPHLVTSITAYDGSAATPGSFIAAHCGTWRIAHGAADWGMTLIPGVFLDVEPAPFRSDKEMNMAALGALMGSLMGDEFDRDDCENAR